MYPAELEIKKKHDGEQHLCFLLGFTPVDRKGRSAAHFPLCQTRRFQLPSSQAHGVFISQLIRYARACSSYECFILRAARLSSKLLRQGFVRGTFEIVPKEVLWSIWGSHQTL